ncbi:MAG: hypothetical protein H7338_00790 [Candidatus Sericytochromatia bacterium]|nr:hypothetical protein [Candidatus Sericytochromatia bacterium]
MDPISQRPDIPPIGGPALPAAPVVAAATSPLTAAALVLFDRLDLNHDGALATKELKLAIDDATWKGTDAATVVTLWEDRKDLAGASPDALKGITRADLTAFGARPSEARSKSADGTFTRAQARVAEKNTQLFPEGLASITPEAVQQGTIGDCYFLSALAGLAAIDPAAIQEMITVKDDGSYEVKFAKKTVTIPPLSDADYARFSGSPQGNWVTVIDKAFQAYTPHADTGGLARGIRALTGNRSKAYLAMKPFSAEKLTRDISKAQQEGRIMVASRTWTKAGDLRPGHVYTILGYDAVRDRVSIRDPHGDIGPAKNGRIELSAAEFRDLFDLVSIQRR